MPESIYLTASSGFLWGALGATLAEAMSFVKLRRQTRTPPQWARSWFYVICTIVYICIGGLVVYLYIDEGHLFTKLVAVNIGAVGPLIIERAWNQTKPPNLGPID